MALNLEGRKELLGMWIAETEEAALAALEQFAERWDEKYPQIS